MRPCAECADGVIRTAASGRAPRCAAFAAAQIVVIRTGRFARISQEREPFADPRKAAVRMMKKSICILLAALMLGALVFAAIGAVRADADVGNFNDYGDGGGGDYGGGDYGGYDYGDGYDSGDGDFAFLFGWLFSSSVGPYAAIPIVLLIVFLVIRSNMKHGRRGHRGPSAHVPPPAVYTVYTDNSGAVEAEVRAAGDEAFSMADFLSAAETVFVKLQYAWTARDWESIRPFESNRLFNKHKTQLEEYIRLGRTDVMERISVNRSYAVSRVATGEEERIAVYLEAALTATTSSRPSRARCFRATPKRATKSATCSPSSARSALKTDASGATETIQCPHCGANVEVIRSGKCEYCGSVVYSEVYDWVLDELDAAGR